MSNFKELCEILEGEIQRAYTEGVTMPEAEKLAAQFLHAQLHISEELKSNDLDARMRKSGLKAIRAAIYLEKRNNSEGKPTEAALAAMVDSDELVMGEQNALDKAEVERDNLERYYNIFSNGHIYMRGIAKGSFGG